MNRNRTNRQLGRKLQKGATMWTTLSITLMVAFLVYLAFKLGDVYLDHSIVRGSMQEIANQQGFKDMTALQISSAMQKRMMIDNIRGFDKDAFTVSRDKTGTKFIVIKYSKKVPIAGNVSALVEFEEEIRPSRK